MASPLPIDPLIPEVVERLRKDRALVLEAEPGAGKTTRVPWALGEAGFGGKGEVVVLQPRRIAARMAARRIAEEQGEKLGERVGYQVRFEDVSSPRTKVRLVTEGVLTRKLVSDPLLPGIGCVVLDEFHERHLQGDLALALLRRLQTTTRPDLAVLVMSATLEAAPIQAFLGGCGRTIAPGRRFEVTVQHLDKPDDRHLDLQVASAVRRLVNEGLDGDVLVFLPGAAEIRRAMTACQPIAEGHDLELVALHGDLSPEEQDRAVRKGSRRKVVLSTNVAESSVTLDGVVAVVDSGLARIAGHSPWSGMPTLKTGKVSRASCIQRTGRAGRLRPGRCLRLFTAYDFEARPDHEAPEVSRLDLSETSLALHGLGVHDLNAFGWFERPPAAALEATDALLRQLGALDGAGALTAIGRDLGQLPLHPRPGRVLVEAKRLGLGEDGAVLAALLSEGSIRSSSLFEGGPGGRKARLSAPSDVLEEMALFEEARASRFEPERLRSIGVDVGGARRVDRVRQQLGRFTRGGGQPPKDTETALLQALLAGHPDRVARRRADKVQPGAGASELLLVGGGSALLDDASVVRDATWLVAVEAEERTQAPRPGLAPVRGTRIRWASAIEPDWLLELFPDQVVAESLLSWNAEAERVEGTSRMRFGPLVLEESREHRLDPEQAGQTLATAALARGLSHFLPEGGLEGLRERVGFLAQHMPDLALPRFDDAMLAAELPRLCFGMTRFSELRDFDLMDALLGLLGPHRAALDEWAPRSLRLPGGRNVTIHYEPAKPPWAESFLSDFFGLARGPALAKGRVPLVLHLLAPNRRAVQVTTDLAGFWEKHYPVLRKELGRRYPRHPWPDDPLHATPPAPRPPRPPRR